MARETGVHHERVGYEPDSDIEPNKHDYGLEPLDDQGGWNTIFRVFNFDHVISVRDSSSEPFKKYAASGSAN